MRRLFETFSEQANRAMGSPIAFTLATFSILIWALTGPFFHFSDLWQLTVNTGTTIITFLLGFIIANAQNHSATRDHAAMETLDRLEREHGAQLSDLHTVNRQQLTLLVTLLIWPLIIGGAVLTLHHRRKAHEEYDHASRSQRRRPNTLRAIRLHN